MDCNSPREIQDIYQCIEWAGTQPWSNGKVGMLGISYYASNQWRVAGLHPPHLAAIIPWEGQNDRYRDSGYHGGILSEFQKLWARHQVVNIQFGMGARAKKNPNTGESVAGPVTMSDEELAKNRLNVYDELKKHPFDDEWHRERSADLSRVTVPLLTCANWGGQGIHPRGNFNGFTETTSKQKWLEVHGDSHWALFSSGYGLMLQKQFFDFFLKGLDNGWDRTPPVTLNIRHPDATFTLRQSRSGRWPAPAGPSSTSIPRHGAQPRAGGHAGTVEYAAMGAGVTFSLTLDRETEITGPIVAKLFVSSSTRDADLFLVVRVFDPQGKELTFMGSTDPNTPIANGWLRVSHRRLDPKKSKPWQPYHPHDRVELLTPDEVYECDIEILPTCIVVPAGWRVALTVRGKDYEYEGELSDFAKSFHYGTRGTGGMTHADPDYRPPAIFDNHVTLHAGGDHQSWLMLPIIPPRVISGLAQEYRQAPGDPWADGASCFPPPRGIIGFRLAAASVRGRRRAIRLPMDAGRMLL